MPVKVAVAAALVSVPRSVRRVEREAAMEVAVTPRRAQVLDLVRSHIETHGHSPGVTELAAALGVNKSTASRHIAALEREGLVRRAEGLRRSVSLVEQRRAMGVEPELFQALFNLMHEVRAGLAFGDQNRVERALAAARATADAWMNKTLAPCPPLPEEGCTEVARPPAGPAAGPAPIPV